MGKRKGFAGETFFLAGKRPRAIESSLVPLNEGGRRILFLQREVRGAEPRRDWPPTAEGVPSPSPRIPSQKNFNWKLLTNPLLRAFLFCLVLIATTAQSSWAGGNTDALPHTERLEYILRWGPLRVGTAVLEIQPEILASGLPGRRFVMDARSNTLVDIFFKVRDRIEGVTDQAMTASLLYKKSLLEGSLHREFTTRFDPQALRAWYEEEGKPLRITNLVPGTFDPLSVFHVLRTVSLPPGGVAEAWVSDGKKLVRMRVSASEKEEFYLRGKKYDALRAEVFLPEIDGVFRTGPDSRFSIWVTPEVPRVPLRIQCGLLVGGFRGVMTADLVAEERSPNLSPDFALPSLTSLSH